MIHFMVVGAPPYPGYRGCFVTNGNQDMVFIWALLIIWDGRKYKYIVQRPSDGKVVLLMLMLVPAVQSCE